MKAGSVHMVLLPLQKEKSEMGTSSKELKYLAWQNGSKQKMCFNRYHKGAGETWSFLDPDLLMDGVDRLEAL